MPDRREIGHAEARRLVAMIGDRLEADGQGAAVAVVDRHGELVAFLRTDGCGLASINIAIHPTSPAWSHDGVWVLFVDFERRQPMLIAADGSAVINLAFPATHPRLSPAP